jgi:dTDP-L-rhamnose 4-epimerase
MQDVILLTGGAGFIGCHLASALGTERGMVVAVDNLHPQVHPNRSRPKELPSNVELIIADIVDSAFWDKFLTLYNPKVVFHLAAETGTGQSLTHSARHANTNVLGTAEMLDAFTRAGAIPDHLLLSSSRAVYGEGAWRSKAGEVFYPTRRTREQLERGQWNFFGPDRAEAQPIAHNALTTHPVPSSIYGATKLAQEHIVSAWASAMKIPLSIFRFQNVYGAGQSPFNPYTGIITLFHRVAGSGHAIDVYEDGLIGRDFVYVSDVVRACVASIDSIPRGTRVLDVGTGHATTILDAAKIIAKIHKAPEPVISGKFRDGDVRWAVSDPVELENTIGIRAEIDFVNEGALRVGEWLKLQGLM